VIPISRPSVGEHELNAVREVFESGWLGEGRVVGDFEAWLAQYTSCEHVVAVGTGTAALHLALLAAGVGPGDEVIMPSFTFAADAMAILWCGATPVFCDIDETSLNLDSADLVRHLGPRTRAILPTDYSGLPADTMSIRNALGQKDTKIIRDASHSFGSRIKGKRLGLMEADDLTCFSFDPIKNITCGEGGAILCRNREVMDSLLAMRRLGFSDSAWEGFSKYRTVTSTVTQNGFRYHMSNINAAIGLAQSRKVDELVERRKQIARLYDQCLAGVPHLSLLLRDYNEICPFMYIVLVQGGHRDGLSEHLAAEGIHSGLRYFPCHMQPIFHDQGRPALPVTERVAEQALSIPLYHGLADDKVREIAEKISEYMRRC